MGEGIGHVVFLRGIGMVSRADKGIKLWFIIAIFSLSISLVFICHTLAVSINYIKNDSYIR